MRLLVVIFGVLSAGIVSAGYTYFRHYEMKYRSQEERQLSAIADLKVSEIVEWRNERLRDASVLSGNPSFSDVVARFLTNPADVGAK